MNPIHYKEACIFGGTGFIGRQIVRELARQGYRIKVATRIPEKAYFLKPSGHVGQIVPFLYDPGNEGSIRDALKGCDVVINCVGILAEKRRGGFQKAHTDLPRMIAKACRDEKCAKFIHISALGAEQSGSKYGKSKLAGELAVLENFPKAAILRPGVVFGTEDNFFNMFARLSVVLPCLPLIGGGKTRLQPVYVGDVAEAAMAAIRREDCGGKIYELGGPAVMSFREIYETLFAQTGRRKGLVSLPWGIAKFQGAVMSLLPSPPLTADQVESLKTDSVVSAGALGFKDLGIVPKDAGMILPTYLERYRPGGRFGDKKKA